VISSISKSFDALAGAGAGAGAVAHDPVGLAHTEGEARRMKVTTVSNSLVVNRRRRWRRYEWCMAAAGAPYDRVSVQVVGGGRWRWWQRQ
jgi:hypothetical protein